MFKIGDRVTIKPDCVFLAYPKMNPSGVEGSIVKDDHGGGGEGTLNFYVHWDNGTMNCYAEEDLDLVEPVYIKDSMYE